DFCQLHFTNATEPYRAYLDPSRFGLNFSALVFVTLREGDRQAVSAFEVAVKEIPQIIQAQRLTSTLVMKTIVKDRALPI
ncbi:AsnC family transcriptional regulator, partial [Salmonella enterica]|nr:AsnC family transcriptional regulator [Salmonella enterica]ECQ7945144.1 AsnC family transcriptional regulator [Salmonella enterica]